VQAFINLKAALTCRLPDEAAWLSAKQCKIFLIRVKDVLKIMCMYTHTLSIQLKWTGIYQFLTNFQIYLCMFSFNSSSVWGFVAVHIDGARLRLWTAATNGRIAYPLGDILIWRGNLFAVAEVGLTVSQHGQSGGPWATSGPRPLITWPVNLFVNFALVATRLFDLFRRIKKSWVSSGLLLYVQVSNILLPLKTYRKM
jgi:hypothetical protein